MNKPNPGSDEAIRMDCSCPIMDNGYGRGSMYGEGVFIFSADCPLHYPGEPVLYAVEDGDE